MSTTSTLYPVPCSLRGRRPFPPSQQPVVLRSISAEDGVTWKIEAFARSDSGCLGRPGDAYPAADGTQPQTRRIGPAAPSHPRPWRFAGLVRHDHRFARSHPRGHRHRPAGLWCERGPAGSPHDPGLRRRRDRVADRTGPARHRRSRQLARRPVGVRARPPRRRSRRPLLSLRCAASKIQAPRPPSRSSRRVLNKKASRPARSRSPS